MLLFLGHLIFEMSAGYELKQLAPGKDDYKTVHKSVKPVLEHIFDDELSHSISDVRKLVISYIKFHTHFFFYLSIISLHFRLKITVSLTCCFLN